MKSTTINGMKFAVSAPYTEGHTVNAAEAAVLNQVRAENVGNNLRAKIKETETAALAKLGVTELNDEQVEQLRAYIQDNIVSTYDAEYKLEFRVPAAPRVTDPVELEARKLAKAILRQAVIAKGIKWKSLTDEQKAKLSEKEDELVVKGSKIWKQAEANVKKATEASAGILEDMGL